METPFKFDNLDEIGGKELKILTVPNSILKSKAEDVTEFDEELVTLTKNMLYTMYLSPGIGLAGNQVGVLKKIFVIDVDYDREEVAGADGEEFRYSGFSPKVFINPVISNGEGKVSTQEGCLSVPEIYENVDRFEKIKVDYKNLNGEDCSIDAEELLSICIQHENDHLNGIVFLDRLSELKKQFYLKKLKKRKKIYG